jgi:hypothetical protein
MMTYERVNAADAPEGSFTLRLSGDPDTDPEAAGDLHGPVMAGLAYREALAGDLTGMYGDFDLTESAMLHARRVMERMAPRDPVEEMLVAQLLATHARVMRLNWLANKQESYHGIKTITEYADRATNTYRRQMLALAEYRKPPRAGDSFTAIRQANVAQNQVVVNGDSERPENATNEQGSGGEPTPALPADARRAGIVACKRGEGEAVGAGHRAEDG